MHEEELPSALIDIAVRSGIEFGWRLADFPAVVDAAAKAGFACIGGQIQWVFPDGIYEAYWLDADSGEQAPGEPWDDFVERARLEVRQAFDTMTKSTDFEAETNGWEILRAKRAAGVDIADHLIFVAYFERRPDLESLEENGIP